ncbi:serine/threonine protein kinase [Sphaeroforma arctica JP610]|uniref:non-specific serine/threonine protein kinase n=1 Tax=Sphaeroforma arctica JP610 TaxID=667725 RepID=A0A0L0G746_9EUKA|nr:serine/threonine protein kinase [Sphaeroforma arctica JP610]KNC84862.1 serine/threonine protein kinase [Sphaeroforma arctica JP610]|eukprot:XP_014158764.1 serine/threonine protein kinase [Sphaeroforma arctica JP610]
MCPSDEVKTRLRRAIEERRYLVTVSRFADCIRVARMDSIALTTPEFKLAIPASDPTGNKEFLAYIVDADACYKHILQVRQIREPVIKLVMECCAVLRDVQIGAEAGGERDYLKRAEAALATFDTLQSQIRSGKEIVPDVISERNCMRQRCLALIENTLQNRSNDPRPEIGVRAAEALSKLRTRPPVPNSESSYVNDDEDFHRLCKDACIAAETFAAGLGHNTSQKKTCDMVADNARETIPRMLLRGHESESADKITKWRCLEQCFAGLAEELAFQRDSAENVTKASLLFGICVRLETALDALVPDVMEMEKLRAECTNNTRVRKRWDAQIVLAGNEIEEARLREEFGVWESNTRRRDKAVGQEVAAWLQFADTHYPELLQNANVRTTFTGKYELECAAQGMLRRDDSAVNYQLVRLLSDKKGRPVRLVTDFEGKHVVLKSYSLTTSSHFSHFMRTCSKLGALRGVINIVPVIGVFTEDQWGHVLMYYYSGGDLAAWINGHPKRDPKLCLRIAHQVVAAVESLHTRDIVHCDLKPENIFLTSKLEAVLGDFDDVRDADCTVTTARVTRKYEAPEIRSGLVSRFDKSADVYSLGLVLKGLFSGVSVSDTCTAATGTAIATLVAQMTKEKPAERPTLPEVTAMPMFNECSAVWDLL